MGGLLSAMSWVVLGDSEYVIMTTSNIIASSQELTSFVASREAMGFDVQIVDNSHEGWHGGTGQPAATNIRTWLQENYTNVAGDQTISHVLLIGDPDPSTGDIPMKMCRPDVTCPTDAYYAELTADWDPDGDGHAAEWGEFYTTSALELRSYEVLVGRIPYYGNITNLDSILSKLVEYCEEGRLSALWRTNALLAMDSEMMLTRTDIAGQNIRNNAVIPADWSCHRIYDRSDYSPETTPCTFISVTNRWANQSYGSVFWLSHGSPTWANDVITVSRISVLDDTHPSFVFLGSCSNAHPETANNLAYSLLEHGAVNTIGATRHVSQSFDYEAPGSFYRIQSLYAEGIVKKRESASEALYELKRAEAPDRASFLRNYLAFNVYGCPAMSPYSVRFSGPQWSF